MLGSGVKIRVGRVTGNKGIFLFGLRESINWRKSTRSSERLRSLHWCLRPCLQISMYSHYKNNQNNLYVYTAAVHVIVCKNSPQPTVHILEILHTFSKPLTFLLTAVIYNMSGNMLWGHICWNRDLLCFCWHL